MAIEFIKYISCKYALTFSHTTVFATSKSTVQINRKESNYSNDRNS